MSNLFVNKVAAALLASALGFITINQFADSVVHTETPTAPAYQLAVTETATIVVEPEPFPSTAWLDGRDAAKGAKVFKKCTSCHNAKSGGKNGTGPALWNLVDRPIGASDGFAYSANMAAKGGTWGYEELDAFLTKPKNFIPKTKMAFNGLKKEGDRAALIEFLRLQADTPIEALVATTIEIVEGDMIVEEHAPITNGEVAHGEQTAPAGGH